MIKNNRNNEQIYGRNDMIMLDQNNKIYGSLGLADRYVMKTEEGTKLILSNPKLGSFDDVLTELNIYGMSKQECTTGAQLYDMDTRLNVDGIEYKKNGTSYTVNIVKMSGNLLYGVPFQFSKEDVDATLSVSQFSNLEQPNVRINLLDSEGNVVGTLWAKNAEKEISAKCSKIRFDWSKGGKFIVSDLMLNFGNTALPYEPYTGGKPSPSPDYPQEIKSVVNPTVKVTNEDETESQTVTLPYTLNAIPVSRGGNVTIGEQQYISDYLDIEKGKLYRKTKRLNLKDVDAINIAHGFHK